MIRTVIILSFLVLSTCVGTAQQTFQLSGVVRSSEGEVLPYAVVKIDSVKHVVGHSNGSYEVIITEGTHAIEVAYLGCQPYKKSIVINGDLKYDIVLKSIIDKIIDVEVEIDLIKEEETKGFVLHTVDTKPYQASTVELNDVIREAPGIIVRQEGGVGSRSKYSLNGLGGRSVRFFLDGVPMDYFGSSFSLNTIPISYIDKIEIYKGVSPAHLGGDALGGSVNLIADKSRHNGGELSYSYGSFNTHQLSGLGLWRDSSTGVTAKVLAFIHHSDNDYHVWGEDVYVTNLQTFEIERDIKAKRFHDAFSSQSLLTHIGVTNKKWVDQMYVGMLYSGLQKEIQHGPTMEVVYGEATYQQRVKMPHITYQKYDLIKNVDVNVFAGYSILNRERVDTSTKIYNWYGEVEGYRTLGGEQVRTLNELKEQTWLTRTNLVYQMTNRFKWVINHVFSSTKRTDNDPLLTQVDEGYWAPQKVRKHVTGFALQGDTKNQKLKYTIFTKHFSLQANVKTDTYIDGNKVYDSNQNNVNEPGVGLAIAYTPVSFLPLMLSVERTARLPESDELLGDGLAVRYSDSLRAERSTNVNLGAQLYLFQKKKSQLKLVVNGFYRNVTDLIQQYQYDLGAFVHLNFNEVKMTGVDFSFDYQHQRRVNVSASVAYLNPLIKSEINQDGYSNVNYNTRLPNTPFFTQHLSCRYRINDVFQKKSKLNVYWTTRYVASFYRYAENIGEFNKDKIPAQLINSMGVNYVFPKERMSCSIDIKNIFNEQAFDNYAIQRPGRSMFIKVMYKF